MDTNLFILGIVFIILAYLIGVKKQTWLLSGFNQKRVRDQEKLAKMTGGYNFFVGFVMILGSFIQVVNLEIIFPIIIVGYVILLGYVNTRMVE